MVSLAGRIHTLSTDFVAGTVDLGPAADPPWVYASLGAKILGAATACVAPWTPNPDKITRDYVIVFPESLEPDALDHVQVLALGASKPFTRQRALKIERQQPRRVFVLGSPRSGTSAIARIIAGQLALPSRGEAHGAALFAAAHEAVRGGVASGQAMQRYLRRSHASAEIVRMTRQSYFGLHRSASFLEKSPGRPMILAAPFMAECFPDARFIYLQRNGISNVLSRPKKFGGSFEDHCASWAAVAQAWMSVRATLPHYVEIRQEEMVQQADGTARRIADYLGAPEQQPDIARDLSHEKVEHTGAGVGRARLADAGWTSDQIAIFRRHCGPTMQSLGYAMDAA